MTLLPVEFDAFEASVFTPLSAVFYFFADDMA